MAVCSQKKYLRGTNTGISHYQPNREVQREIGKKLKARCTYRETLLALARRHGLNAERREFLVRHFESKFRIGTTNRHRPYDNLTLYSPLVLEKEVNYKCARCGGEFEAGWSEEEALAEKAADFGEMPMDQMALVCDDCYNVIMPIAKLTGLHPMHPMSPEAEYVLAHYLAHCLRKIDERQ